MKTRALLISLALGALPLAAQVNLGRWASAAQAGPATQVGPASAAEINASNSLGPGADLHLEFPIYNRALPNRAQLQAVLVYDSLFWGAPNGSWQPQSGNGWWLRTNGGHLTRTEEQDYGACGWTDGSGSDDGSGNIYYFTFTLQEPDGSGVPMGTVTEASPPYGRHYEGYYWDCPSGDGLPESFNSNDGKGFSVVVNGTYDDVTGAAYDGYGDNVTTGLTDPDGNSMSATSSTLSDALGGAVSIAGSNPQTFTYTGPNATPETITVNYTSINVSANFGCYNGWSGVLTVPSSIQYPDGSTYAFGYDGAGRLDEVTYPGGGNVTYQHSEVVQCSPWTVIESFKQYDSLDGGNFWEWQYNNSSGGNETTQTDPYGNSVTTSFDSAGNVTEEDAYNGAHQVTSTLVTGTVYNRTWTTYLQGAAPLVASHNQVIDGYGFTNSTSDTDWGTNSPGAVLRKTADVYTPTAGGEVLTSAAVEGGSGNQLSKTTWTVDGNGNPLSETDYTNNSAGLTTSFVVNSNGTIQKVTEPNGAATTFAYQCGTGFYPDSVQTVVGTTTAVWDCNGGAETSATGLNGHTASVAYDAMWRPITINRADGSSVNLSYPASGNGFARTERSLSGDGTTYGDTVTSMDTLGRPVIQQLRQSPGGMSYDSVQTCYDAMARPIFVTVPYSAALGIPEFPTCPSAATAGGTFTAYDGLSRPITVVDGGGGETDYAYFQNDTLSTVKGSNNPNVSRQEQFDGIGRLQSVCEVTAGTGTGGNWPGASCGQTNGESGYLTTYAYTYNAVAQGSTTTITQNAQSGNPLVEETRTLQFDQLGRMLSETDPETQQLATTYTYDSSGCGNSAGDLVERQDAIGNITCYSHDAAHRITEISYSGPNTTPNKYFAYGTSINETVQGFGLTNVLGRLVEASTGSPATDEVFSYSNLGQGNWVAQASPSSGGWYQIGEDYWAGGAVKDLNLKNNSGEYLVPEISYAVNGEGEATSVGDGTATPPVTAATWQPEGLGTLTFGSSDGHTDQDVYSFDAATGRLSGYTFNVAGQADSGMLSWDQNGELLSHTITDAVASGDNGLNCGYGHDDVGRLNAANCDYGSGGVSKQTMTFDPFGNVCKTATAGTSFCPSYNLYNLMAAGTPAVYDLDGNLENDPTENATVVNVFDAEGRPTKFEDESVVFDALGRTVEGGGDEFVYAPDGSKLALMNGQGLVRADVPLPGGAEAVYTSNGSAAYYRHADLLGSSRLATTQAGGLYAETAFAPYGEPIATAGAEDRSFTGKKQDIANGEAGTDPNGSYDFPAREYSPGQSRWWTPDPAGIAVADFEDPQSFNRYAYANCDPLAFVDPTGMATCDVRVGVNNEAGASDLKSIEDRVNQIFAATPTAGGDTTQILFGDSAPQVTLLFSPAGGYGHGIGLTPAMPGNFAEVFMGTIGYYFGGWSQGDQALVTGTAAAHELVHAISGIPDENAGATDPANLMQIDLALRLGFTDLAGTSMARTSPSDFSKLTQGQADALYRLCKKLNRPKDGSGSGGGGPEFGGGWTYSETWSCGPEGCGPSGGGFWYDGGGLIPIRFILTGPVE